MSQALQRWNALDPEAASAAILPCNGSEAWASGLAGLRPFPDVQALFAAADAVWWKLEPQAWQQAFDTHPRIGEREAVGAATAASVAWSAGEQSAATAQPEAQAVLLQANQHYQERFGRVFLICATGKTASAILDALRRRLGNSDEAELREAAEQQRRITQLRLRKWLGLPPAACEDV